MTSDPKAVSARIRSFFAAHAANGVVLHDEPDRYYLGTNEVRPKDGYRTMFGGLRSRWLMFRRT